MYRLGGSRRTRPTARTTGSGATWRNTGSDTCGRPKNQSLGCGLGYGNGGSRADMVTADASAEAWKKLSAGDGAKGPRLYDCLESHPGDDLGGPGGFQRWLLIRRSLTR